MRHKYIFGPVVPSFRPGNSSGIDQPYSQTPYLAPPNEISMRVLAMNVIISSEFSVAPPSVCLFSWIFTYLILVKIFVILNLNYWLKYITNFHVTCVQLNLQKHVWVWLIWWFFFPYSFTNRFETISNTQYKSILVKIHYWKVHKQGDYIFQKDSLTHSWAIQLNKYEPASNFIQLTQNLTPNCLLI